MPFLDLSRRTRALAPRLEPRLRAVLESGRLLDGPELAAFEAEWAAATTRAHAVGVASGTDALRLALLALGAGPGREVIVPAFTAIPTAAAVCATGATPVPVDVDRETATLDAAAAAAALSAETVAAIAVHLYGRPAEVPELGVPVIEDAAHAHGLAPSRRAVAAAHSFYPTKNLAGVADGGAVVTDDPELAARIRRLRAHGREPDGRHVVPATNSRMSELEAASLRLAIEDLEAANARRRQIALAYRRAAPWLDWQLDHPDHVHHLCVARVADRDAFRARLPFESAVHYPRAVTAEPAYARFERGPTPQAHAWAASCVSLPCYPELRDEELELIAAVLARGEGRRDVAGAMLNAPG